MAGQRQPVVKVEDDSSLSDDLAAVIDQLEGVSEPEETSGESIIDAEPRQEGTPAEAEEEVSQETQPEQEKAGAGAPEPVEKAKEQFKPPIDWSPTLKQEFKKLPDPVRKAIHDNEVARAKLMQSTVEDRRTAHALRQIVEPYRAMMVAEGVQDPLAGISGLLKTTAQLAFGNQQQKAVRIADLIKHYNVDIETLDSVLAGEQPPAAAQPQTVSDPRIDAIWQRIQQAEQTQKQQVQTRAAGSIQEFSQNPENEFFDDVRLIMADFLDVAAKNGLPMTLEDAYHRACAAHPEVSSILANRWGQQKAESSRTAAQRKADAASSISGRRGAGGARTIEEDRSIRDLLEEKIPGSGRI